MQPNKISMVFAQIVNCTSIPGSTPSLTTNGLPFGSNEALSPPVVVSGDILGFGDLSNCTIAFFGLNETSGKWTTGTPWVAAVSGGDVYKASIPVGSDQFAAVVMLTSFWTSFLQANPATNGSVTVSALPTAQDNPGKVIFSTVFTAGLGRSISWGVGSNPVITPDDLSFTVGHGPESHSCRGVIPPGSSFPLYPEMIPARLECAELDDGNGDYTVNGQPVKPTDPAFISKLFVGEPYGPTESTMQGSPHNMQILTVVGVSLNPSVSCGYLSIMLYQDSGGSLYIMWAYAGPTCPLVTQGYQIYAGNPHEVVDVKLTATLNIFSDQVAFNIVSASVSEKSAQSNALTVIKDIVKAVNKVGKLLIKMMFTVGT